MSWQNQLNGDALSWVLEEDSPGIRYLAMRDLLDLAHDDPELQVVRTKAHMDGPIAAVRDEMEKDGYFKEGK